MRKEELEKRVKELLKFGLTEYQAKVFVGVLALSEAKAPELVSLVDIPKARVYQILGELLEMGAVRKKPSRPVTYLAINPESALKNILDWKREKMEKELDVLGEVKTGLLPHLGKLSQAEKPQIKRKYFLEVMPAGEISEIETKRMYASAKKEMRILTGVFEYLPRVLPELNNAGKRGVTVKILLLDPGRLDEMGRNIQRQVIDVLEGLKNIEIRFSTDMPLRAGIADESFAIFSVDERKSLPLQKDVAMSENENMVKALSNYFDFMWGKARNFKT